MTAISTERELTKSEKRDYKPVKFMVPSHTIVHINGIPCWTLGEYLLETSAGNVPMVFEDIKC